MSDSEIYLVKKNLGRTPSMGWEPETEPYPDGSPMAKFDSPAFESGDTLVLRPTSLGSFITGLYLADARRERGRPIKRLVLPFVPGGRQDRINEAGDYLFTLKSVANDINRRGFERVVTVDPHSVATGSAIDNLDTYPLERLFGHGAWPGYTAVVAPDAGAGKRAEAMAAAIGRPLVQATKHRDVETGRLSDFRVDVEEGGHYLVVDDICDGGGTFVGLGERIREQGAFCSLFVTHGLFTKGTERLLEIYKTIQTTDSTPHPKPGVSVMPITERLIAWTR